MRSKSDLCFLGLIHSKINLLKSEDYPQVLDLLNKILEPKEDILKTTRAKNTTTMSKPYIPEEIRTKMKESPVLVVGAGGIGCELLKNLVMVGFENIEIIDLDTIEVSNLNRQFLFQRQHVGESKAKVARETVLKFNPNANIVAHHASVIGPEFNLEFFKKFKLVMNALDNVKARGHVNRMCLAVEVPLIESGSNGLTGQVEMILKGQTKCYECEPKVTAKTYPSCTIRNTPSEHIHCTIWAKHLFNQLFGEEDADFDVSPDTKKDQENEVFKTPAQKVISTREWAKSVSFDPEKLFSKLFTDDINYLLQMKHLWENRRKPVPIVWGAVPDFSNSRPTTTSDIKDQKQWTLKECVEVFTESLTKIKESSEKLEPGNYLIWEKNDEAHMDFLAACANLRAYTFHIDLKTKFDIKSMAGNIVPAVATSNAVIAGLVTFQAIKLLEERYSDCPTVYLRAKLSARKMLIVPENQLVPPNKDCRVCGADAELKLVANLSTMTCKDLETLVLKQKLNMPAPDVSVDAQIIISSDPEETEENNIKTLQEMGIKDGTVLFIDDFIQTYKLKIILSHREMGEGEPSFYLVKNSDELQEAINEAVKEYELAMNGIKPDEKDAVKRKISKQKIHSSPKKRKTVEQPIEEMDE